MIHRVPGDVQMGMLHCSIRKNHMIFCGHVDHKWYCKVKTMVPESLSLALVGYFQDFQHQGQIHFLWKVQN